MFGKAKVVVVCCFGLLVGFSIWSAGVFILETALMISFYVTNVWVCLRIWRPPWFLLVKGHIN